MQRSQQLIPLSHDHHHGLVFCKRIESRLDKQEDPARIIEYVLDFWRKELVSHFEEEEHQFFPLLPETNSELVQALSEHAALRALIHEFETSNGSQTEQLRRFASLLRSHIRFEERVLFPLIEQRLQA